MQFLKADTAATILIGPFLDKGDGVTPEEGITLAAADSAELMKHDGTTFVDLTSDSRTFTHREKGMYTLVLGTGDTDTEGRLTVFISDESICLPVWKDFMVVNANVYDSLYAVAATDYLQVDALGTDTLSELSQGIPSATPTIKAALMLLYMIARNKLTTTSTELGVYNDAGTKIAKKTLTDDGTTFTEAEMASGA